MTRSHPAAVCRARTAHVLLRASTATLLLTATSRATTRTYIGPHNGRFADVGTDANWSPTGTPGTGDDVFITTPTSATTTFGVILDGPTVDLNSLTLDGSNVPLLLTLSAGVSYTSLSAATEIVGNTATATLSQTGGVHTPGTLILANTAGSSGTYRLSGGTSTLAASAAYIGYAGNASFSQTSGVNASSAIYLASSPGVTATYSQVGGTNVANDVYLASAAGSSASYSIAANMTLLAPGAIYVGDRGSASLTQNGGTLGPSYVTGTFPIPVFPTGASTSLVLGYRPGAAGSYILSSGLSAPTTSYVGFAGNGTVTQTGGVHSISGALYLAYAPGSTGSYAMSGGSLSAAAAYIGYSGTGSLTQTATSYQTTFSPASLSIGHNPGSTGTYTLADPSATYLDVTTYVGYAGSGSFVQTAGAHTFMGGSFSNPAALYLGYAPGSTGSYALSGGTLAGMSYSSIYVGYNGEGTFAQSGGSVYGSSLFVGNNASPGASYLLSAGSLAASSNAFIGNGAPGTFVQTGGTHSSTVVTIANASPASYSLSAGTFNPSTEYLGRGARATFTQTGGTHSPHDLYVGYSGSAAAASYDLSSGTLTVAGNEYLGYAGHATFTQTGGTNAVTGTLSVAGTSSGSIGGSFATYALSAGSVSAGTLTVGSTISNASFLQTGGTVTATSFNLIGYGRYTLTGGTLTIGTLNSSVTPSAFTWTGGTVSLTNSYSLSSTTLLGTSPTLSFSQTLAYALPFTVPTNTTLTLAGGTLLSTAVGSTATVSNSGTISGYGTFATRVINTGSFTLTGGPSSFSSTFTNTGGRTVNVQNATATFAGSFSNSGALSLVNGTVFAAVGVTNPTAPIPYPSVVSLDATSSLTAPFIRQGTLTNAGSVTLSTNATPTASLLSSLTLTGAGLLDLANNPFMLNYATTDSPTATAAQLRQYLLAHQLFSSTADGAPQSHQSLGYMDNALLGLNTWFTLTADPTSLLVKLVPTGDANFDGKVNADDYALVDRGMASGGSYWWQGDFNYDGQITSADYLLIDTTVASAQGLSTEFLAMRESQFGAEYVSSLLTSVPEPSAVVCLFAGCLFARRRSRR